MKNLFFLFAIVLAAGCAAPRQLPKPARREYRYVFYGLHRRLTDEQDTRARRLFQNYIEARVKWLKDEDCPCACDYNDLADWDKMIDAECDIYNFIDEIK